MAKSPKQIPFSDVLKALVDENSPYFHALTHRFSDLVDEDINQLKNVWNNVPMVRKQSLLEDIEKLGESDYTLSFEEFCLFALDDEDPKVREIAIRSLWDYDNRNAMKRFMYILENDPDTMVRAAAALALGKFIYLGEIEEIPEKIFKDIESLLLKTLNSSAASIIRRRALEAMGFSSRKEMIKHIQTAFDSDSIEWKTSALFAMGRSADERWIPHIKSMLTDDNNDLRYEATRSAGELEAKKCTKELIQLLDDDDKDISTAAIWSLSQIGGEGIQEILEKRLEKAKSDDEAEYIESALENLEFTDSSALLSLLEYSGEDDDLDFLGDLDDIDDLDDDWFDIDEDDDDEDDED